jgi:inner membrane protease ATP23
MAADPLEPSASPIAGPSSQPDSAFERWRSGLAQLTGLGLSPEEVKVRDQRLAHERMETDWNRCESWKNGLMKTSKLGLNETTSRARS